MKLDSGAYTCFNKGGLSDLDGSSTSVDRVLACDGSSPTGSSFDVGLWTRVSSLGEAISPLADMVVKV